MAKHKNVLRATESLWRNSLEKELGNLQVFFISLSPSEPPVMVFPKIAWFDVNSFELPSVIGHATA